MATISKSETGVDFETKNNESNNDVVSIGDEEVVSNENDNTKGSLTSLRSHTSTSNLVTTSQKSLRKKTMLKNHQNTSFLSMQSITSQDEDDNDQEMYHFEQHDDVINIDDDDSNHSSRQELNLSTVSFSDFGKYERAETASEEDLVIANQFMYSLAKVRIYMDWLICIYLKWEGKSFCFVFLRVSAVQK